MTKETNIGNVLTQIQTEYSKGINSDSSQLSFRYIYSKALGIRARLLSQKSKNKQTVSDSSYNTLSCVEMVEVPVTSCPYLPPMNCRVVRSKDKIPAIISNHNTEIIKSVATVAPIQGQLHVFSQVEKSRLQYQKGSKFAANTKKFYLHDGYLYLQSTVTPRFVELVAVFYDPFEAEKFNIQSCGIEDCITPYDMEFRIDWEMAQPLITMTSETIQVAFGTLQRNDKNEDNVDDNQRAREQDET